MPYLPKSKINIQNTPGGELMYKFTKKDYIGSFIETSDGKFYAGGDLSDLSTELVFPLISKVTFGNGKDVRKYKNIQPNPHLSLSNTQPVIGTKPHPTEKDYERGSFPRYFIKKHNGDTDYVEIDNITYTKLERKDSTYDYRLYEVGAIEWALSGKVHEINNLNIKLREKEFPFLYVLFPVLNEYQKIGRRVMRNKSTKFSYRYPNS